MQSPKSYVRIKNDTAKRRRKIFLKKFITILITIAFILLIIFGGFIFIMKQIYPKKYENIVEKYAEEYQIDENMIFALIKAESNFEEDVISNRGAVGLMQLMESTAEEIASNLNYNDFVVEDLKEPEVNIQFGVKYFSELLNHYQNNYLLALTAYNAGIGNVEKWIENEIIQPDGSDIENIPFQETNMYVRKILRDYDIYKKLY